MERVRSIVRALAGDIGGFVRESTAGWCVHRLSSARLRSFVCHADREDAGCGGQRARMRGKRAWRSLPGTSLGRRVWLAGWGRGASPKLSALVVRHGLPTLALRCRQRVDNPLREISSAMEPQQME